MNKCFIISAQNGLRSQYHNLVRSLDRIEYSYRDSTAGGEREIERDI
jgi:hypothetical protein